VILVSHARTFTNAFAEDIYEVEAGRLRHFTGTFEEYVAVLADRATWIDEGPTASPPEDKAARMVAKEERKRLALLDKQRKREQGKRWTGIAKLDRQKSEILAWYFDNPLDYAPDKATKLKELEEEMAQLEKKWMRIEEEMGEDPLAQS